jgi:hypothetical protein
VKPLSTKTKLALVGIGYVAVLAFAANEFYERHVYELNHREEVAAASGMFAGGDLILELFIAFLFMIPTFFLVCIGAKFEAPYTSYSKTLLMVGFSAPVALGLLFFANKLLPENITVICFERLLWSPFILALIAMSRLMARFDYAKRLTSYALLLEGATFCMSIAVIVYSMVPGRA